MGQFRAGFTVSRTHGALMDEVGMGKRGWDGLLISADSPQGEPCFLAAPHEKFRKL